MDYPIKILPHPDYKLIECDLNGNYLLRVIRDADKANMLTATGNIKVELICSPKEQISDLSVALLGVYTESEIGISLTSKGKSFYSEYCEPDANIYPPNNPDDFTIVDTNHFWCIPIEKINNTLFDYTVGEHDSFVSNCLTIHSPARWNYWHFSIRWQIGANLLEDLTEKERAKIAKRLAHNVRVIFSEYALISIPDYKSLDRDKFCKN